MHRKTRNNNTQVVAEAEDEAGNLMELQEPQMEAVVEEGMGVTVGHAQRANFSSLTGIKKAKPTKLATG
ncbi:hypothetical protein ACLKA6_006712 [Drosophila palustris]